MLVFASSGYCALCGGREQVRLAGPGLPDDTPPLPAPGRHPQGEGTPLDFPQQRIPEAAARFGHEVAKQSRERTCSDPPYDFTLNVFQAAERWAGCVWSAKTPSKHLSGLIRTLLAVVYSEKQSWEYN